MPSSNMPKVPHVSSPSDLTALMMLETVSISFGFGPRHAAPIQKRLAPRALAICAFSTM